MEKFSLNNAASKSKDGHPEVNPKQKESLAKHTFEERVQKRVSVRNILEAHYQKSR